VGPRQVGKTTAARQIADQWKGETVFAAADAPLPQGPEWIHAQWNQALSKCRDSKKTLLILDEIQKVRGWSETVKLLWDREIHEQKGLEVLLLGSSALLVQKGLGESLAGRFFLHRCGHWGWPEMREAFGWSLEEWIYFGGYPGSAKFRDDEADWKRYVADSLVETVLSRDVLQLQTVAKPTLLRHLFGLAVGYPAQIFSYNKMLDQLQDAGNTTTLAHYLKLLESAFVVSGLEIYRGGRVTKKGGSPKLILWNNALVSAYGSSDFANAKRDGVLWGRLVENAVGAHLLDRLNRPGQDGVLYWRERDKEVDFVAKTPKGVWGIEVKSGKSGKNEGLGAFLKEYPKAKVLLVGIGGMELEEFFKSDPAKLFG
jgi:predicted AAA+ superfamily ATPase